MRREGEVRGVAACGAEGGDAIGIANERNSKQGWSVEGGGAGDEDVDFADDCAQKG